MRIGILGMGGVGGFVGALLSNTYSSTPGVEIIFIARGKNKDAITQNGIRVIMPAKEIEARPALISNDPAEIGQLDLLILSTKSYDLQSAITSILPVISEQTILLPLINGVNAKQVIRDIIEHERIADGFMYIVSNLQEPGVVKVSGKGHSLYIGSTGINIPELEAIKDLFIAAGINAIKPENILKAAWEKFFFISTMATITSALDKKIHEIADDESMVEKWKELLFELKTLAIAKNIPMDDDLIEKTIAKAMPLPADATTSMHRDSKAGKRTEVESLTGYVVKEAELLGISLPVYKKYYEKIKAPEPGSKV